MVYVMRKKLLVSVCIGSLIVGMFLLYFFRVSSEKEVITLLPDESEIYEKR